MFADAYRITTQFTRPVVISRRQLDGSVKSGLGAFIVLNEDGWIMTAAHMFDTYMAAEQHKPLVEKYRAEVAAIEGDTSLNAKQKAKRIRRIKNDPEWITNHAFLWWRGDVKMPQVTVNREIDLAVGRLEPWEPAWVSNYPTLKDPTKDMQHGRSLCKLGFPLHDISATFDEDKNAFALDLSATTFFPLEGIYTRNVIYGRTSDDKYERKLLETSSPGLMGQSGGPIFDVQGTVWAVQVRTDHYELGFRPEAKKGRENTVEHQFLGVGLGVHPEVIVAFLRDNDIEFQLSGY